MWPCLGPYDFRDEENTDGIAESSNKNGIYSLTRNVSKFGWINKKQVINLKSNRDMD